MKMFFGLKSETRVTLKFRAWSAQSARSVLGWCSNKETCVEFG